MYAYLWEVCEFSLWHYNNSDFNIGDLKNSFFFLKILILLLSEDALAHSSPYLATE